jgi:hypothetical protein
VADAAAAVMACFPDEHRACLQEERPEEHISWGDACQDMQTEHQRNFLTWLEEQFRPGITAEQLCARFNA